MFGPFKKEKPLLGLTGMGGGAGGHLVGGAGAVKPGGHEASGGMLSDYADPTGQNWRAHVFTAPGTFTIDTLSAAYPANVEVLCVGGGGGGGSLDAGGGGGGGVLYKKTNTVTASGMAVTVGGGGYANGGYNNPGAPHGQNAGSSGGASSIVISPTVTREARGGGQGCSYYSNPSYASIELEGEGKGGSHGARGASTGGGGNTMAATPSQPGYGEAGHPSAADIESPGNIGWGNKGGSGYGGYKAGGGGGGGAYSVGENYGGPPYNPSNGGDGGSGAPYTISKGSSVGFGGGGGGGKQDGTTSGADVVGGDGGYGGGGRGGANTTSIGNGQGPITEGVAGTDFLGGGGGGGGGTSGYANAPGGSGGHGCVIVRYKVENLGGTAKATGGLISYYDGKVIHTFLHDDTFTVTAPGGVDAHFVLVGGGAGGGAWSGAGGGAGGYYATTSTVPFPAAGHAVKVGKGGSGSGGASYPYPDNHMSTNPGDYPAAGIGLQDRQQNGGYTQLNNSPTTYARVEGGGRGGGYQPNCNQFSWGAPGGSGGGGVNTGPTQEVGAGGGWNHTSPGGSQVSSPLIPAPARDAQGNNGAKPAGGDSQTVSGGGGGGAGGVGKAGSTGGTPSSRGGSGGLGIQLPAIFRDPAQQIGYPGPGSGDAAKHWVAGGGGGGAQIPGGYPSNNAGGLGGGGLTWSSPTDVTHSPTYDFAGSYAGAGNGAGRNNTSAGPMYGGLNITPTGEAHSAHWGATGPDYPTNTTKKWPGGYSAMTGSGSGGGGGNGGPEGGPQQSPPGTSFIGGGVAGGKGGSGIVLIAYPQ